jgi:cardiolipin synthase
MFKTLFDLDSMPSFHDFFSQYWPHIIFVISGVAATVAAIHAAMTKKDVRAATGWVAVILFSPLFGALIYAIAGINRIHKARVTQQRTGTDYSEDVIEHVLVRDVTAYCGPQFSGLKTLGDHISDFNLLGCNAIKLLSGGDETYPAMLAEIEQAQYSIAMQSYIFDSDAIGTKIAQALIDAKNRGVEVRVLIDAVGSRYSHPPITKMLIKAGVKTALFLRPAIGLKLVYANLRSHRKLLVVDGFHGLTGGMNIRESFLTEIAKEQVTRDTHFKVSGPIAHQLMINFAMDWQFTTQEKLLGELWFPKRGVIDFPEAGVPLRCVVSGPDNSLGNNQKLIMGALSLAQKHVRIQSPYFLPDQSLIAVLATTARRGVQVDIVIPGANNLKLVDAAMSAQLDQLLSTGCRIWRSTGNFDHSKLLTIDGMWSYVGSSNLDPRSLRLNFELDLEVYDKTLAAQLDQRIDAVIAKAVRVTLQALEKDPFLIRLRNKIVWLASPYL